MAKFEAEELARYDKKHPTRTAPENSVKNTGRKQKERIRQKAKYVRAIQLSQKRFLFLIKYSRAKMSEIQAARDAAKPLDRRQGELSAEDLNMDMHDPDFRAPDFPKRK